MSDIPNKKDVSPDASGDAIKQFQLSATGKDKSSPEYGRAISKYIWSTTSFTVGGYYYNRNARFIKNRNYANGRIDIQAMYQDRFKFNAKQNYISLNFNALQIVNRIHTSLVGRWMRRNEKIQVKAIDDLSQTQKEEEYDQIQFILDNRQKLEKLQQESGVQIIPEGQFIPADKEELNLWQRQFQLLPEEILFETGCNDVLSSNGWFDVLKEKMLHDAAETLFVGTYTWMDNKGVIHVRPVKAENAIYSYSEYYDFRDATWLGEAPTLKISEIRRMWGKEFNPDNPLALTEKEIYEKILPACKEWQYQSNIAWNWNDQWVLAFTRPYDEWNVRSMQFEIRSVDTDNYTVTNTNTNGRTYIQKGLPTTRLGNERQKPSTNQNILVDTNCNIYRGVYLPDCDVLLQWGLKENMITPQDPREVGDKEFSYSFFMPQNYQMRNLAIPEKIEAAVDGMILACLKIQQDVAASIPPGWVIDESGLENIDYGLGDAGNKGVDHVRQFLQTGKLWYRGENEDGTRRPPPITEIANTGFAVHIDAFVKTYQFWYQSLKDELGADPNLISAALQPRVTTDNVETSQAQSEFATDYIYMAYVECMKMTARKVACLLKDSVMFGAKAYRNILKQEDIGERIFATDIRFLPTQFQIQRFEAIMNQAMASNPQLVMFLDPFQLMRIAAEDVKLAEKLFRQAQRKALIHAQETAQMNQQQVIEGQIKSAQMAEEEKRRTKQEEIDGDIRKAEMTGQAQNKTSVLNMVAQLLQKQQETGVPMPSEIKPLADAVIQNVMLSAIVSTEEQKKQIMQQMMEAQMAQQQQEQENQMQQQQPQPQLQQEVAA